MALHIAPARAAGLALTRARYTCDVDELAADRNFWDAHPDQSDADIDIVCRACVSYQADCEDVIQPDDDHPGYWAVKAVEDANRDRLVEIQWRLIMRLCEVCDPDPDGVLGMVAAGPLYDYIQFRSRGELGRIEEAAPHSPKLLVALAGVWGDAAVNARIDRFLAAHGQPRLSDETAGVGGWTHEPGVGQPPQALAEALAVVLQDMQRPRPVSLCIGYDGRLRVGEVGESGVSLQHFDLRGQALLVQVADWLQEQVFPETRGAWGEARPRCPGHGHPASAGLADGRACWRCPDDG